MMYPFIAGRHLPSFGLKLDNLSPMNERRDHPQPQFQLSNPLVANPMGWLADRIFRAAQSGCQFHGRVKSRGVFDCLLRPGTPRDVFFAADRIIYVGKRKSSGVRHFQREGAPEAGSQIACASRWTRGKRLLPRKARMQYCAVPGVLESDVKPI